MKLLHRTAKDLRQVVVLLAYYMARDILKKKNMKKTTRKLKHKSRTPRTAYLMSSLIH
jgi:hypothetical protein